ncbi:MAG: hypothetical protein JSS83_09765 [Cyanobacteria bacterium SZAS LIN-3]|nr:hypothetical protein [Cyanobacteria bacterium SZAS LIN-3]
MDHTFAAPSESHVESTRSVIAAEAAAGYDPRATFFSNGNPINFSQERQIVVSPYPGHPPEHWHYDNGGGCLGAANPSASIVLDTPGGEVSQRSNRFNPQDMQQGFFSNADMRNMSSPDIERLFDALAENHKTESRSKKEAPPPPASACTEGEESN